MTMLKFRELSPRQQAQATARFIDAGTPRDDYWYELTYCGDVLCRNRDDPEPSDVPDEGLDNV